MGEDYADIVNGIVLPEYVEDSIDGYRIAVTRPSGQPSIWRESAKAKDILRDAIRRAIYDAERAALALPQGEARPVAWACYYCGRAEPERAEWADADAPLGTPAYRCPTCLKLQERPTPPPPASEAPMDDLSCSMAGLPIAPVLDENEIRENESAWWIRMILNPVHDLKALRGIAENYPMSKPTAPPADVAKGDGEAVALLREAMGYLDDPSDYYGNCKRSDFEARVDALLRARGGA